MADLLLFIRNIILAAVLAWLGFEFSPERKDTPPDKENESVAIFSLLN